MIGYQGQPGIGSVMPPEADYVRVANDLREKIRKVGSLALGEGADREVWTLEPGSKLPTKLQLVQIYGVSGSSIDTAMVLLREWGFVIGHPGKARYVAEGKDDLRPT